MSLISDNKFCYEGNFYREKELLSRVGNKVWIVSNIIEKDEERRVRYVLKKFGSEMFYDNEKKVLSKISHKNCVRMIEDVYPQCILYEYLEGYIELHDFIFQNKTIKEADARYIIKQVIEAVKHLHENKFIHCDLKPSNILVHPETLDVKLIDFESCEDLHTKSRAVLYTLDYISPEYLRINKIISPSMDCWAIGVIVFNMIYGIRPFYSKKEILSGKYYSENLVFPYKLKSFLNLCFKIDPEKRITLEEMLEHCWIKE